MPTNSPVEFNRWVQVPAGEEKYEPCTLSNDYAQNELFQLRISEDSTPGEVVARVPVAVRQQETLELSVRAPEDSEPGVFPFTVIADLESRNLRLSIPGLRVVPPLGGWKAELQPGPELKARPWQNGAQASIELTNQSNDWLYCDIQVLNTNNAWDYRLTSRRVCLPPWVDANRKHGAANNNLTAALLSGASTREDRPLAPVPTKSVRLIARPKRKKWFGAMPEGTGETNVTLKISRLNPETGGAAAHFEQQFRVVYVPMKGAGDLWQALQPAFQRIGAFFRFLFSRQGLFVAGGIAAAIFVLTVGWENIWFNCRDFMWSPKITRFELADPSKKSYTQGQKVTVRINAENLDELTIHSEGDGGPPPITYRNPKDKGDGNNPAIKYTGVPPTVTLDVGPPGSQYSLVIDGRRVRHYSNGKIDPGKTAWLDPIVKPIPINVTGATSISASPGGAGSGIESSAPGSTPGNGGGPGRGSQNGQTSGSEGVSGISAQQQLPGGVRPVTIGDADQVYAQWAAEALDLKVNDPAGGPYRIAVVGPGRVPPGTKVRSGVPVIGIGEEGAQFLQRLDRERFRFSATRRAAATGLNSPDLNLLGLGLSGATIPVADKDTPFATINQDLLGTMDMGTPLVLSRVHSGKRADPGTEEVVVGWQANHGFWGFTTPADLQDEMKILFQHLVRKVCGLPQKEAPGQ